MSLDSQQYANLADHCYDRDGYLARLAKAREVVEIEGVQHKILKHVDNPRNGYQGTVYQRMDSGAIVVAHRGTEPGRELRQDMLTNAGMVATRSNRQAGDAIALTEWAREYAQREGRQPGKHTPEVTVTGHSLGGVLAQVTAHHFDLRGETFNAYGAVGLNRRIPEGGDKMINHVMAADFVSAGSPHYGEVRIYATPREIATLQAAGYHENRVLDALVPDRPVLAAAGSFGSHPMHHFLNVDGNGRPDRSVLGDPEARRLAETYQRTIEDYRNDVGAIRQGVTIGTRSGIGLVRDGIDHLRGPLPAGEPARREERNAPWNPQAPSERPIESGLFKDNGPLSLPEYLSPERGPQTPLRQDRSQPDASSPSSWRFGDPPGDSLPVSDIARYTARIDRMLASAKSNDWQAFREDTRTLANSDAARAMREQAVETVDRQEQWAAQQQAEQQQMQVQQQQSHSRGFSR